MTPPDEPKNLPEDFLRDRDAAPEPTSPYGSNPYGQPAPGQASQGQANPYGQASQDQTNPYGQAGSNPYGDAPAANPYGQQPAYGQPYPQQPGYGQAYPQPGYGVAYPAAAPPHPSASTSMVLAIIGLAGIMFCGGITLFLSPFAWAMGSKAVREIDANPGMYSGRDQANGGKIMGIIGTVLLILGILLLGALIVLGFMAADSTSNYSYDTY